MPAPTGQVKVNNSSSGRENTDEKITTPIGTTGGRRAKELVKCQAKMVACVDINKMSESFPLQRSISMTHEKARLASTNKKPYEPSPKTFVRERSPLNGTSMSENAHHFTKCNRIGSKLSKRLDHNGHQEGSALPKLQRSHSMKFQPTSLQVVCEMSDERSPYFASDHIMSYSQRDIPSLIKENMPASAIPMQQTGIHISNSLLVTDAKLNVTNNSEYGRLVGKLRNGKISSQSLHNNKMKLLARGEGLGGTARDGYFVGKNLTQTKRKKDTVESDGEMKPNKKLVHDATGVKSGAKIPTRSNYVRNRSPPLLNGHSGCNTKNGAGEHNFLRTTSPTGKDGGVGKRNNGVNTYRNGLRATQPAKSDPTSAIVREKNRLNDAITLRHQTKPHDNCEVVTRGNFSRTMQVDNVWCDELAQHEEWVKVEELYLNSILLDQDEERSDLGSHHQAESMSISSTDSCSDLGPNECLMASPNHNIYSKTKSTTFVKRLPQPKKFIKTVINSGVMSSRIVTPKSISTLGSKDKRMNVSQQNGKLYSDSVTISTNGYNVNAHKKDSKAGTEVISNIRRPKAETARGIQPKKSIRKISEPVKVGRPNDHSSSRITNNNTYHFSDELKQKDAELCINKALVVRYREESHQNRLGLEALSIIVQHLSTEYDPFSTPQLKLQVDRLCSKLDQLKLNLDESSATVQRLQHESQKATEEHEERVQVLQERNAHELSQVRDHHTNEIARINSEHSKKLYEVWEEERSKRKSLEENHLLDLEKAKTELHACLETTKREQVETIELIQKSHSNELKELECLSVQKEKEYQSNQLKLESEKEVLREQAKRLERTLLSDKDHKLQAARGVCTAMEKEVDSLKTVIEMKNGEIHQLRDKVVDRETLTDNLQAARERIRTLRAKTEDLTEQMDKKSESERQWYGEYRNMSDSFQRESCINRRLTQDNEELQWKIRNRELNLSSINNDSSAQDLLSRSGHPPFLESAHRQFSSTPIKMKRTTSCEQRNGREFGSLGDSFNIEPLAAESSSSGMKTMIEKSNSVSFILNLDSCSQRDFPVHTRQSKKPTLTLKRGVTKSTSTPHVNGGSVAASNCPSRRKANGINRSKLHLNFASNENLRHRQQRSSRSTSESSDGFERVSPTGVAWTVSADPAVKCPVVAELSPPRSLLRHPVEDEYEEEQETAFIDSLDTLQFTDSLESSQNTTLKAHPLCNILEGRDSASPSGSDASQCGSRVELSTTDADSSSSDDEGTEMAGLTAHWVLQEGAGEAMVAKDALGSRHSDLTDKDSDRPQSNVTSLFSSDSEDVLGKGSLTMSWSEDCELTSSSEMQDF